MVYFRQQMFNSFKSKYMCLIFVNSNRLSCSLLFRTILIKYLLPVSGALQGDVKLLQANTVHGTALGSEDNANIKSKLSNLESNQTNSYSELIKVKNHVDEVNAKIDMIEANKNTNIAAIQENTDVLTIALTELEDHKSILQNISTILDVLTSNSSDMTNDRSTVIHMNTTFESNIEKNQVKIEENVLNINMLSENVTAQHILLHDQSTRTRTLEVDVTLVKDAIQVLNDTIKHVKTNTCMCEQNESLHERLFGLDNITTQVQSVKDYVANYSDHINDLETSQVALNFEIQVLHNAVQKLELNANFTQQILEDTSANIQLLELQANSTQHAFIEHGTRMHAIELELGNLEDYNKRIEQVETETNFTKDTLEDIKTRIEDIEHVGNVTQNSVQDIIGKLANMTGNQCNGYHVGWF